MVRAFSSVFALLALACHAETPVTETRTFTDPQLGLTVVTGTVALPAAGWWSVTDPGKDSPVFQIQLTPPPGDEPASRGIRNRKAEREIKTEQERYPLWSLFSLCSQYAMTNNGVGPNAWSDINTSNKVRYIPRDFTTLSTNFFLIPAIPISQTGTPRSERKLLILQLRPVVADGKHWVTYSDGQSERIAINPQLCSQYGIAIQPQSPPETTPPKSESHTPQFVISALMRPGAGSQSARLSCSNLTTGAHVELAWPLDKATGGDRTVLSTWARQRAMNWLSLAHQGDAPVLQYWLSRSDALYDTGMSPSDNSGGRNRGESADAFSVLGGRAAVRETLQMQPILQGATPGGTPSVAISTIPGVEVTSHPFEEMLKTVTPGSLPLAESVPADRAFAYFPKPEALLPLLNGGGEFVFQGSSLAMANPASYDLKARYVDRLALSEQWVRDLLLKSGAVKELAIMVPDLFFIEGTEITVLARIPAASLIKPALSALGMGKLGAGVQEKLGPAGASYWAMDGDLLIISTSRGEVDRIIALRKAGGANSLGRSAEFRYMLSQLPPRAETRAYCYLSDPFIRRLVGPEVKISQLRRLFARSEMETVSAAALLYRLDGQPGQPDLPTLVKKGYLAKEPAGAPGCTLDANLAASCPAYGSPARLKSLLENPAAMATAAEAQAYKTYVENYSRFWRQFFDPMAFRLDDGPAGELQLTTFILPLLDNSIYNGIKEVMRHKEDGTPLRLPDLTPKPLLLLSANLSEDTWTKVTREMFSELLRRYTTLDPTAFDKIGPGIHLAVHDADPILTFGSGDALGIFGAPMVSGGRGAEMMFIPVIASILTRPSQLIVELQDPDAVRRMMLAAASAPLSRNRRWEPAVRFYKVEGRDAWVCTFSMENIVTLRFGVEVRDTFLILSNLPWSQKPSFGPTRNAELNAMALELRPESGLLQMPGLFTAACEQERAAAVQGERYLYPLLASGAGSVPEAVNLSRTLFGLIPEHPGKGQWVWENGRVRSTVYGDSAHPVQPEYKPGDRVFGLLGGLDTLNLNLQFEATGLRVVTRWKMKPDATP